jgi:hypothetical protein
MITITFCIRYPAWMQLPPEAACFRLWEGYGIRSASEARYWALRRLADDQFVEFLDETGEPWGFYSATVQDVLACDIDLKVLSD